VIITSKCGCKFLVVGGEEQDNEDLAQFHWCPDHLPSPLAVRED
jgi:hypothetical protein